MFLYGLTLLVISIIYLGLGLESVMNTKYYLIEVSLLSMGLESGGVYFFFDGVTCLFLFIVCLISSMVTFYSIDYMEGDPHKEKFILMLLMFVLSMNFMVVSPNIFMILLGWDGLGLVSYCLVIYYSNEGASSAGMITVMTNRFGDIGLLLSLVFMASMNSFSFFVMNQDEGLSMGALGLTFLVAAATKSAQMPFSSWLPAAMAAPTPVSSLVHSSTLVTAGVYLILRLNLLYNEENLSIILLVVSVMTMFMSGLGAMFETDLKKVIALSTLSQLGVMMMILSLGASDLALFHLLTHALFKAMLFMCAGVAIHGMGGWQDLRSLSGLWQLSPFVSMMMLLGNMSLFGVPFLSGFYSKDLILELLYSVNSSFVILTMVVLGTLFSVLYSLRMMYYLLLKNNFIRETNYLDGKKMAYTIYLMGVSVVLFGCLMSWGYFTHPIFIFLNLKIKMLNLILIMGGLYFTYVQFSEVWASGEQKSFFFFFGEMWFLKNLSSGLLFFVQKQSQFYGKGAEMWIEVAGGQGVKTEVEFIMLWVQSFLMGGLKYLLMLMLGLAVVYIYF